MGHHHLDTNDLSFRAVHEAAHHVAARKLCLPYGDAAFCRPDYPGYPPQIGTRPYKLGQFRAGNVTCFAMIVALMCGAEAEIEFFGQMRVVDSDEEHIWRIVDELHEDTMSWELREVLIRDFAQELVRRRRDHIERVAEEMIVTGMASVAQIDALERPQWLSNWADALDGEHGIWIVTRASARRVGVLTRWMLAAANDNEVRLRWIGHVVSSIDTATIIVSIVLTLLLI